MAVIKTSDKRNNWFLNEKHDFKNKTIVADKNVQWFFAHRDKVIT